LNKAWRLSTSIKTELAKLKPSDGKELCWVRT